MKFSMSTLITASIITTSLLILTYSLQPSDKASVLPALAFADAEIDDVKLALVNDDIAVVDTRSPDAFNGWALQKGILDPDKVVGHIPGAELFSARWITLQKNLKKDALQRGYQYAGLDKVREVILYGDDRQQAKITANWLVEQGWEAKNIRVFAGGIASWAASEKLEYLPGFKTIVPPEYVAQAIERGSDIKVVQIGWDGKKALDYRKEHVPGSIYWDDIEFEMPPIWENRPVKVIRTSLAKLGLTKDSAVVVVSTDPIMMARAAAVMKYAGINDVVIMNSTIELWKQMGMPLESGWNEPQPVSSFNLSGLGNSQVIIDIDEAKALREQPNSALVSVRTWKEFIGETSGYNYFEKKGRIKGALWGHAGTSAWNMDHYRNPDNTMRNYNQISAFWSDWNIRKDMTLAFYCGNGARASEAWWYAQAMGYTQSRVYTSGWMRWRTDSEAIAKGDITRQAALADWQATSAMN